MLIKQEGGKFICAKHGEILVLSNMVQTQQGPMPICPRCKQVAEQQMCEECETHPAEVNFTEGTIAAMHGILERLCRCCYLKRSEEFAEGAKKTVAQLKKSIAERPCTNKVFVS